MDETQMPQNENISIEELKDRLDKLESDVNILNTQSDLMKQFELEYKLLNSGLTSGSKGVAAAFVMFTLIFIANGFFYYKNGSSLMSSGDMLWLSVILSGALLIYFAFIFRFTFKLVADWKARSAILTTERVGMDGASRQKNRH
jgi:ABC-type uncharacterized transport system permease subunit